MAISTEAARIKAVRKTLGISQRDFCKSIFLSLSFYAKIETGARNPNKRVYELISSKYNVSKDWLLTGKGDMFFAAPPDVELSQVVETISELDPPFREYIMQQIKLFVALHRKSKESAPDNNNL